MKALLVGKDWFPNLAGGLNRYFYGEARALPAVGVSGTALVSALRPGQCAPFPLQAMAVEGAPLRERWRGARLAVRTALREEPAFIQAHFALYAYPWLRDIPSSVPFLFHFHGPYAYELAAERRGVKGQLQFVHAKILERAVYRRADRLFTLSEAFREIAQTRYGVPAMRLRVVPGGVDLTPYLAAPERFAARETLGWPQERPILLTVRRLARRMGLETLLEAMTEVRRAHPNALLLLGGTGELAGELETKMETFGLKESVRLLGYISESDLPLAYAAADLALVPSAALEGFGLVTVEALASGTPVLGTPIGGTPEILRGLEPNLLFDAATPEAIAARLLSALDGDLVLPDRAACRAYALRYGWEEVAPRLRALFEEAVYGV